MQWSCISIGEERRDAELTAVAGVPSPCTWGSRRRSYVSSEVLLQLCK